jgi:endonuclease/exonuclease/phosphatase (EEP) superfamily protein YafD
MDLNVLIENRNFDKVATLIATENPDLIALEEIDAGWAAHLKNTLKTYPYKMELPQPNAFGIGLYSKIPLRDLQIHFFGKEAAARVYGSSYAATAFPSITALASIGGQAFTIVVTHPLPPLGGFKIRNAQLDDFARIRPHLQKNMILIGDLNTSSWSPYFVELTQRTGLRDSQLGFGVQPSWPSYSPLFRIPIDHILVSPKFVILSRKIGPNVGSDHLPVIVALGLTR